jgi:hypothetical protein
VEDALNALQADAGTLQTQVQAEQAAASSRAVVENPYRDPDLDWGGAGVP